MAEIHPEPSRKDSSYSKEIRNEVSEDTTSKKVNTAKNINAKDEDNKNTNIE